MPECNWCLVKGHVLWHKNCQRMSSASQSSHLRRHPTRLRLPPSLPETHAWSPLCLHHLLTTPSSFAEMHIHQQSGCGDRAAGVTVWICRMDASSRVHGAPHTCCIHLNKAGEQQQWKKLINGFTSSSTTLIHKVNIATGFSSPTVILPILFKYFHLTFKQNSNSSSLSLIFILAKTQMGA